MAKFKEQIFPKPSDANYEPLRSDKTKVPKGSEQGRHLTNFYTALIMIDRFGYRSWMSVFDDVIGPKGETINTKGQIVTI